MTTIFRDYEIQSSKKLRESELLDIISKIQDYDRYASYIDDGSRYEETIKNNKSILKELFEDFSVSYINHPAFQYPINITKESFRNDLW